MQIIDRLAPSPTGFMHIGTAKLALYNWLFARQNNGKFALRIEDTDRTQGRYFPEAAQAIYDELNWLGLAWDELVPSQFARMSRHAEIARELLARGAAYECFMGPEETEKLRQEARRTGLPLRSPYRDPGHPRPEGVKPAIRLKMPLDGSTVFDDIIQGRISIANETLEDPVILRGDGTPTYNLSAAADDHDMGVSHVIRGADHINNTPKQIRIYLAMGWDIPAFAHAPLILGMDGSKMSKRHGGTTTAEYRAAGYLPEALLNFLIRLGWSHGNDEIFSTGDMLAMWRLEDSLKASSKFDPKKLLELNAIHIRRADDSRLAELLSPFMGDISPGDAERLRRGIPLMKERVKTLVEMRDMGQVFLVDGRKERPIDDKAAAALANLKPDGIESIDWNAAAINEWIKARAADLGLKTGQFAAAARAAIARSLISPPLAETMEIIGREESMKRISLCLGGAPL
ncbi:MAG: glutamate--tRNA ligase [Rickettsiales bacterium]|jgi:glutamyl-tRNA synthetase|nr:glutamate--tRNA ligase [Rickettsiales bacterium]